MNERLSRPLIIVAAFAASLAIGLGLTLWLLGGPRTVTAASAIGGPFQLVDQAGQTGHATRTCKGKPTIIFFGFTHCPDVCPTALFEMSEILRAMGNDAKRVNAFFVSVDPERDTPADHEGLSVELRSQPEGPHRQPRGLAEIVSAYRVYAKKVPLKDGDYTMDHTALIYLMDRDGTVRRPVQHQAPAGRSGRGFEAVSCEARDCSAGDSAREATPDSPLGYTPPCA